jgi:DNA-binding transcriptional MerR regulator
MASHHPGIVRYVDGLSSDQFCRAVGVTYRVADYWARQEVLRPGVFDARGSGRSRRYSDRDVEIGRVLAGLTAHGAEVRVLREVAVALSDRLPPSGWLVVTGDGEVDVADDPAAVFERDGLTAAWVVRLEGASEPSMEEASWSASMSV